MPAPKKLYFIQLPQFRESVFVRQYQDRKFDFVGLSMSGGNSIMENEKMRSKPDHDKKHATTDEFGNVTAKDQNGIDVKAKPRTSDNWKFGDSLADVEPIKHK